MLPHYLSHTQKDWSDLLPVLEFAYNNVVKATAGLTPFELDLGYIPVTPHTVDANSEVAAAETFTERQQALRNKAYENNQRVQSHQAEQYKKIKNSKEFQEDDLVLLLTQHTNPPFLQSKGRKKLRSKYIGPFRITRKISPISHELHLPGHMKMHPSINVKYLKPYPKSQPDFAPRSEPPSEPIVNPDMEPKYELAEIRGYRRDRHGKLRLLCHWSGYENFDDTYEPDENPANSQELLNDYRKRHKLT
jgi:hypothetical protein